MLSTVHRALDATRHGILASQEKPFDRGLIGWQLLKDTGWLLELRKGYAIDRQKLPG